MSDVHLVSSLESQPIEINESLPAESPVCEQPLSDVESSSPTATSYSLPQEARSSLVANPGFPVVSLFSPRLSCSSDPSLSRSYYNPENPDEDIAVAQEQFRCGDAEQKRNAIAVFVFHKDQFLQSLDPRFDDNDGPAIALALFGDPDQKAAGRAYVQYVAKNDPVFVDFVLNDMEGVASVEEVRSVQKAVLMALHETGLEGDDKILSFARQTPDRELARSATAILMDTTPPPRTGNAPVLSLVGSNGSASAARVSGETPHFQVLPDRELVFQDGTRVPSVVCVALSPHQIGDLRIALQTFSRNVARPDEFMPRSSETPAVLIPLLAFLKPFQSEPGQRTIREVLKRTDRVLASQDGESGFSLFFLRHRPDQGRVEIGYYPSWRPEEGFLMLAASEDGLPALQSRSSTGEKRIGDEGNGDQRPSVVRCKARVVRQKGNLLFLEMPDPVSDESRCVLVSVPVPPLFYLSLKRESGAIAQDLMRDPPVRWTIKVPSNPDSSHHRGEHDLGGGSEGGYPSEEGDDRNDPEEEDSSEA